MELSSSNIKKFLIFPYISENRDPKKSFLYFRKWDFSFHPEKISYTSGNGDPEKMETLKKFVIFQEMEVSYISANETFLYFRKRNFLMF